MADRQKYPYRRRCECGTEYVCGSKQDYLSGCARCREIAPHEYVAAGRGRWDDEEDLMRRQVDAGFRRCFRQRGMKAPTVCDCAVMRA